jgi:replicative DNA helicase
VNHNGAVLAHDDQAERCVLGAMLVHAQAVTEVRALLRAEDFYRPQHGEVYRAIVAIDDAGTPVDHVTVAAELRARDVLARAGGEAFLLELTAALPTAVNAAYWAELVAEAATRRRIVAAGQRLAQLGGDPSRDPAELIAAARESLDGVGVERTPQRRSSCAVCAGCGSFASSSAVSPSSQAVKASASPRWRCGSPRP